MSAHERYVPARERHELLADSILFDHKSNALAFMEGLIRDALRGGDEAQALEYDKTLQIIEQRLSLQWPRH